MEINNFRAALVAFNNAVRLNNRSPIYRFNRAVCFVSLRQPQMGLNDLNAANMMTPNNPQILIGLALAYHAMGKHLKAKEYAQKARFADPFHPAVQKYDAQRRQREMFRRQYYILPGCSSSCGECLCLGMLCDACCVPGGCCVFRFQ
jgi:tetratricopeptide (TPR) repeat protein